VQRNANYAVSSSTATTTTTTCLQMGERGCGRRWRGREKQCNGYARQQQVCVSHRILCPLPLSPSSPVILRLPPAHDPLLLLPLDLRRAWSMPRSGQARVGAAIAYPALGRHMSRTRGDGGRRANNGGFAALRPRPALRTSSHTQRLQPLAQAQFKITAQRLEGYPRQRTMLLLHDSWRARARLWRGTSRRVYELFSFGEGGYRWFFVFLHSSHPFTSAISLFPLAVPHASTDSSSTGRHRRA
jgi:hypothetical protein